MGVPFRIVLYAANDSQARAAASVAFDRLRELDSILSDWDDSSELMRLCARAGDGSWQQVSDDLMRVLELAQRLARRSRGAFDITVGPFVRLWRKARKTSELPRPEELSRAGAAVGIRYVRLRPQERRVLLEKRGMLLDLGGIAKGYAADAALGALRQSGIRSALVDGGGDIAVGDAPPGESGWRIAVAPLSGRGQPSRVLILANMAVATSGDVWQFVEIGGRRYSHIVDPRTGVGLTDRLSVTVVARSGATADALATAVSVLGPEAGVRLVDETPGCAALILRARNGGVERFESSRFADLPALASWHRTIHFPCGMMQVGWKLLSCRLPAEGSECRSK